MHTAMTLGMSYFLGNSQQRQCIQYYINIIDYVALVRNIVGCSFTYGLLVKPWMENRREYWPRELLD